MNSWRNALPENRAIYVFFVFVLLFSLVSQVHLHLVEAHEHILIDEHSHAKSVHASYDDSHSVNHSDTQVMSLQPDVSRKDVNDNLPDLSLVVFFSLLLFTPFIKRLIQKPPYRSPIMRERRYHNLPALRAPPIIA